MSQIGQNMSFIDLNSKNRKCYTTFEDIIIALAENGNKCDQITC